MSYRRMLVWMALVWVALGCGPAAAQEGRGLKPIRWMLGEWIQHGDPTTIHETWREIDADTFKGVGITVDRSKAGKASEESMLLTEMSGKIYYFAKVQQNQYPVPFELTSSSEKHATFENAKHDFPKKLEYRLVANDAMEVKVSDGGSRGFTIQFKRERKAVKKDG